MITLKKIQKIEIDKNDDFVRGDYHDLSFSDIKDFLTDHVKEDEKWSDPENYDHNQWLTVIECWLNTESPEMQEIEGGWMF